MNQGLKAKIFNLLGTPTVSPAQPVSDILEKNARIVGIILDPGVAGSATFALYMTVSGLSIAVAAGNATLAGNVREWWAGIDNNSHTESVLSAGPANNTITGTLPSAMPTKVQEAVSGVTYDLTLQIVTAIDGQVLVLYTTDPPNCYGEPA